MFDNDIFSEDYENTKVKVGFEYRQYARDGYNLEAEVSRYLRDDQAEYLPHLLDAFKQFLNSIGFTYVEEIVAVKEGGQEATSAEVLF